MSTSTEEKNVDPIDTLRTWLADFEAPEGVCYLYRKGKTGKELMGKYDPADVPDTDQIAAYGPGSYQIWLKLTDRSEKSAYLTIAPEYAERMKPASAPVLSGPASSGFDTIREVLALIGPLIERRSPVDEMSGVWQVMQQMQQQNAVFIQNLLERNMMAQLEMSKQMQEARAVEYEEHEEETSTELAGPAEKILSVIGPLLDRFIPLLANPVTAGGVASVVKSTPEYAEISQNPEAVEQLAEHIAESHGAETTGKVLDALDLPRKRGAGGRFVKAAAE